MSEAEKVIYERRYSIWISDYAGVGKWEYRNTPAEVGRRVEELLLAGKGINREQISVSVEDRRAE